MPDIYEHALMVNTRRTTRPRSSPKARRGARQRAGLRGATWSGTLRASTDGINMP